MSVPFALLTSGQDWLLIVILGIFLLLPVAGALVVLVVVKMSQNPQPRDRHSEEIK